VYANDKIKTKLPESSLKSHRCIDLRKDDAANTLIYKKPRYELSNAHHYGIKQYRHLLNMGETYAFVAIKKENMLGLGFNMSDSMDYLQLNYCFDKLNKIIDKRNGIPKKMHKNRDLFENFLYSMKIGIPIFEKIFKVDRIQGERTVSMKKEFLTFFEQHDKIKSFILECMCSELNINESEEINIDCYSQIIAKELDKGLITYFSKEKTSYSCQTIDLYLLNGPDIMIFTE
jgi:hypothetical protein